MTTAEKIMFTPTEAAEYIGVRKTTFYELVRRGRLRGVHHTPRLVRYHIRDLDAYLDAKRQEEQAS